MKRRLAIIGLFGASLAACTSAVREEGTLAELENVPADLSEVYLEDSLERAARTAIGSDAIVDNQGTRSRATAVVECVPYFTSRFKDIQFQELN